jgi:protein-tyrosine phosphatase
MEEALQIIQRFQQLGTNHIITTPHIMGDLYPNTVENIIHKKNELIKHLHQQQISVCIHAAAEYYLDEKLMCQIQQKQPLLTFGNGYLLFELNFMTEPLNLRDFIFAAMTSGYKPVLAHPERYFFYQQHPDKLSDLIDRGVLLQLNLTSITGYYGRPAALLARKLIENKQIHFVGSDCHNMLHMQALEEALKSRLMRKILSLPLFNWTLNTSDA